jgi:hypothetical protein
MDILLLLLLSSSSSLVTGFLSSLVLLLLCQWWTPPLRLQVSACSTFLMLCDVPSMAVFVKNLLSVVLVLFPDILLLLLLLSLLLLLCLQVSDTEYAFYMSNLQVWGVRTVRNEDPRIRTLRSASISELGKKVISPPPPGEISYFLNVSVVFVQIIWSKASFRWFLNCLRKLVF